MLHVPLHKWVWWYVCCIEPPNIITACLWQAKAKNVHGIALKQGQVCMTGRDGQRCTLATMRACPLQAAHAPLSVAGGSTMMIEMLFPDAL